MANISLPTPGQKPWSLNPAITAINTESTATAATVNTGRLSDASVTAKIAADSVTAVQPQITSARGYSESVALRGAPVLCIAKRTNTVNLSNENGDPPPILFNIEDVDTDGMHDNATNNTRMTIPDGMYGLVWQFEATLEFAANATGSREITIKKNGTSNIATERRTSAGARSTIFTCSTGPILAEPGDYFEVIYYQNSGATLTLGTGFTKFVGRCLGERIGNGGDVLFSADYKYKDLTRYSQVIEGSRITKVDDPVKGPKRQVIKLNVRQQDDSVLYPRAQMATPSFLATGQEYWIGWGQYVPTNFPVYTDSNHSPVIHEVYGPPNGGLGPTVTRILNESVVFAPGQFWPTPIWTTPLLRGQWVDIVQRIFMSDDAATGYVEIYMNTGTGFVQQKFTDNSTRYYLATRLPGINNEGTNFSSLKLAFTAKDIPELTIFYANHRVGRSLSSVDPQSFV